MRRRRAFRLTLLASLMLTPPLLAQAQESLERVEITGSSIKRPVSEGVTTVQVLTRQDMLKAGITTAAEMMATLTGASNNLTDGVSIGTGGVKDQMGLNSVNLRGLGTSSTLVLLNGRRMANFASPGDDAGVDLNNIPAAAIERVEVLLDGASAIYGTDAIGGVVNFITKKDFRGVQLDVYGGKTQEGGAGKRQASITAGAGDLARDGFNVFGVLDFQHTGRLDTSQRKFISELQIPQRLPWLLSGYGFPANIRLQSGDQLDYLQSQNFQVNGQLLDSRTFNLSTPNCNPPHTLYLPAGVGGTFGCTYDFMRDLELSPKSDKTSFLGRGVLALGDKHQLFLEASAARARTWYVGTSNRFPSADIDMALIPQLAATGIVDALPDDHAVSVRGRLLDGGKRASELTSTGTRLVVGMEGTLGRWDYSWAWNHSVNTVHDRDVKGYFIYDKAVEGVESLLINPFGPSSAEGLAYLKSIEINDEVRSARGTMDEIDLKGTTTLAKLSGGDLALALGSEFRREKAASRISDLLASDNILGDDTPGDANTTDNSRKVWAVYAELLAPITKQLELQFAIRHDHYQAVGGTTNPKLGFTYRAMPSLQFRGSVGTGFRAPTLVDLYRPEKVSFTAILPDPVCMAETGNDLATCADSWEAHTHANAKLKPERSRQGSLGLQWQAGKSFSGSADWWFVNKRDLINTLGDDVILANAAKYASLIHRYNQDGNPLCDYDPDDSSICYIDLNKENRGRQKVSGIDLVFQWQGGATPIGKFGAALRGTLTLQSKEQTGYGDPYVSNLGKFVTDGVVQRWRHRLTVDWENGPWGLALTNSYISGYEDQNSAIDTNTGTVVQANRVKAYSLWDMSGSWQALKGLTLRAGVKNMFNTSPPFSNQAYFFISGYDPSYTDPRGRFYYLSASYAFK
ncbi:TonB-dependent receptor [Pelomonas sp. KK5]|uniref:TonB-dependent receptor n=1 Tax=Pelomonas sp. KK5 TaxID=1855730 RepID=UPI001E5E029C|nr:TonB-dependent receptor [Pelomonas sp. KK5]